MVETHVYGPFGHGVAREFQRADLEFYRINHFRPSFVVNVYFNDPDVDEKTDSPERATYAGSFSVFGHTTCVGDEGHCVEHLEVGRFDDRPTPPLTRAFKRIQVTDALRRCLDSDQLRITLIATTNPKAGAGFEGDLLDFQGLQLTTFACGIQCGRCCGGGRHGPECDAGRVQWPAQPCAGPGGR